MNTSMKTSAVDYLASKESYIMPTEFERLAAANKLAIQQGKVTGLTFPAKRKKTGSGCPFKTPRSERLAIVQGINALRLKGVKASDAVKQFGIGYAKYQHWKDDLGIDFKHNARWESANL
jgi:hypothetical protein